MSNIAENICESIQIIGESLLEGLSYDKTVVCTIIDDSDRDKGKYVVQENGGVTYEAYTENTQYRKKNQVYVTIPGNDYNNQKMIIGKKITDENEPIVYSTPFDTIIDIVDLEIDEDKKGVQSLVANRVEQSSITLLEHNSYSQPYYGFTRLGLSAEFRSWLRDFNCFTGEYGLKVTLDFVDGKPIATERLDEDGNSITEMTYPVIRKELYLNHKDMIGNLYSFDTFYNQQKVFDISSYNGIGYIKVEFYEKPGSFLSRNKDEDGNYIPIPYVDDFLMPLEPNLFISNFDISIGYDLSDYNNDFLQLYSFDTPTYSSEEDIKNINLKWIHLDGENQIVMNPDRSEYEYEIRWYRYLMGEPAADAYVTGGWTSIDNEANKEFLTREKDADSEKCYRVQLKPNAAKKAQEEIKAIILFGEKSAPYEVYSFTGDTQEKLDEYYKNSGRFYWYYSGKGKEDGESDDYFYENCENKAYDSGITYYQPIVTNDSLTYKIVNATDIDEKNWEDKKDNLFMQVSGYVNCNQIPRIATKTFTSCQNDSEFINATNYYYSLYFRPKKDLTAVDYYKNPERYYMVTSTSDTEKIKCSKNYPYVDLPNYYYTDESGNYELANPTLQEYEKNPEKYYIKKQIFSCQINQIFNKNNIYWIVSKAEAMTINEKDFPTNKDSLYKYTEDFNPKNRQFYVKKSDTRQVFRTEPIIFSNDVEIDNKEFIQDELQALSALSLRCFDEKDDNPHSYTYGNYFLYNELKELINYEESKVIRGVHCDFNLIETNDNDTHELFNADSISWIIPYGETMINVYNKENKLPEAINLNINLEETLTSSEIKYKKYTYTNLNDVPKTNNAPAFYYTIGSRLMAQRGNNLIRCEVILNGRKYTASYDLTFGEGGTSGTKYTFQIEITSQDQVLTVGKENKIKLTPILYDAMGKEIDISNCKMEWKFVDPQNSDATIEAHNDDILTFSLNGEGLMGKEIFVKSTEKGIGMNTLCIVKGTLEWESYKLTDYVVIPIRSDVNYTNFTGPTEIIYLTDGTPYYDRTYSKFAMGRVENGAFTQSTVYYWNPYNGYVPPTTQSPENSNSQQTTQITPPSIDIYYPNITEYNNPNKDSRLQPVSMYIEQLPIFAIQVKKAILENGEYKEGDWVWTQPILIIQNSYPSSVVNEWDGKKLVIDKDKQLIFGKMLGAGRKEANNSFTGVLMGDYGGNANNNTNLGNHAGIFGFNKGVQCFSFTDDGKATIGSASGAQLKFDGSSSGGSIASNSYEQNKGIKIDFDDAIIDLRNAFTIQKDGEEEQISCFVNMDASSENNASINDYSLQIGYGSSPNFRVNWAGDAYMNNANIQGELNSSCYISGDWSEVTSSASTQITLNEILTSLASNIDRVEGQVSSIKSALYNSGSALSLVNNLNAWKIIHFWEDQGSITAGKYVEATDPPTTEAAFKANKTYEKYYYWQSVNNEDMYYQCTSNDWNKIDHDKKSETKKDDTFYVYEPPKTTNTINMGWSEDALPYIKCSKAGISLSLSDTVELTNRSALSGFACKGDFEVTQKLILGTTSYGKNPPDPQSASEGQIFFQLV